MWSSCIRRRGSQGWLVIWSWKYLDSIRLIFTSFGLEQLTTKTLNQNFNRHKGIDLWTKTIKNFENFGRYFSLATSAKKGTQHVRACASRNGANCSKNKQLSHIIGATNTRNSAPLRPSPIMCIVWKGLHWLPRRLIRRPCGKLQLASCSVIDLYIFPTLFLFLWFTFRITKSSVIQHRSNWTLISSNTTSNSPFLFVTVATSASLKNGEDLGDEVGVSR